MCIYIHIHVYIHMHVYIYIYVCLYNLYAYNVYIYIHVCMMQHTARFEPARAALGGTCRWEHVDGRSSRPVDDDCGSSWGRPRFSP